MYEATFRITGEGAYEEATRGTDATVELWCNDHCDLLYVSESASETVERRVREHVGVEHVVADGEEVIIITTDCLKQHTTNHIETYLARHDCLLLPPIRYENGEKLCRIVTIDAAGLTEFYDDIRQQFAVTVDSKREIGKYSQGQNLFTIDSTLPELSGQQQTAISLACRDGYYRIPRDVTTAELAAEMNIDRRTFEEHLRRAENKLITTLIEHHYT